MKTPKQKKVPTCKKSLQVDCDCKEISCAENCTRNHTHKEFFCEKCYPEIYNCKPNKTRLTSNKQPTAKSKSISNKNPIIRHILKVPEGYKFYLTREYGYVIVNEFIPKHKKLDKVCPTCHADISFKWRK